MTVRELIQELAGYDGTMKVVRDEHSEYKEISDSSIVPMRDKGGWYDVAYTAKDNLHLQNVVYIR